MSEHHYFAASVTDWVTAPTREGALVKLAKALGSGYMTRARKQTGGIPAVIFRVELPECAHYSISEYRPYKITREDGKDNKRAGEFVPLSESESVFITNMKGATVPRKGNR